MSSAFRLIFLILKRGVLGAPFRLDELGRIMDVFMPVLVDANW